MISVLISFLYFNDIIFIVSWKYLYLYCWLTVLIPYEYILLLYILLFSHLFFLLPLGVQASDWYCFPTTTTLFHSSKYSIFLLIHTCFRPSSPDICDVNFVLGHLFSFFSGVILSRTVLIQDYRILKYMP